MTARPQTPDPPRSRRAFRRQTQPNLSRIVQKVKRCFPENFWARRLQLFRPLRRLAYAMHTRRVFLFLTLIVNALATQGQSGARTLALPPRPAYAPERFFVTQVLDERPQPGAAGTHFGESTPGGAPPKPVPLAVSNEGLERFLKAARRADTTRWAIVVRVKKLLFSEKLASPARQADGQLAAVLAFDVLRNGQRTHLTDFEGGAKFSRPVGPSELHGSLLRQTLEAGLRYLDQWLQRNAPGQEALARRVRVTFNPGFTGSPDKGDTVFYAARRPLVWDDFRGAPRSGKNYGAAVFSSFGYEATARTVGGVVEVVMTLKVYQLKNSSWAWPVAKHDYALRHEQLHFDITRLVAERFRQKLQQEDLQPDEYDSRIQFLFLESFREMNKLQEQYDDETAHSVNRAAQARWDEKITGELRPFLARNP